MRGACLSAAHMQTLGFDPPTKYESIYNKWLVIQGVFVVSVVCAMVVEQSHVVPWDNELANNVGHGLFPDPDSDPGSWFHMNMFLSMAAALGVFTIVAGLEGCKQHRLFVAASMWSFFAHMLPLIVITLTEPWSKENSANRADAAKENVPLRLKHWRNLLPDVTPSGMLILPKIPLAIAVFGGTLFLFKKVFGSYLR